MTSDMIVVDYSKYALGDIEVRGKRLLAPLLYEVDEILCQRLCEQLSYSYRSVALYCPVVLLNNDFIAYQ